MLDINWIDFIGGVINVFTVIYLLAKIVMGKIDIKNYKFYILTFILVFLIFMSTIYVDTYFRFVINTILYSCYCKLVFKSSLGESVIATVIEQTIMLVSEVVISSIIILTLGNDVEKIVNTMLGTVFANLSISILSIAIISIPWIFKICMKIKKSLLNMTIKYKYLYISFFVVTLNILLAIVYFGKSVMYMLIINVTFMIIYALILWLALNEKNENIKFKAENMALMDNLDDYEKMLDYQRVANHENKNQLLVVKDMLKKNDDKTIEYIEEIIKDKREDNEVLLSQAKTIPTGGLQGIIYQKMLLMEENNIKINLEVDRDIRKLNFDNIDSKLNYDMCRIVGIFLDNAIDEVKKIENKSVEVCLSNENENLVIIVSNYCENIPDVTKIDNLGYSTKGNGHGYGLSLVKEIISKNQNIENERSLIKNVFSQKLKIKM